MNHSLNHQVTEIEEGRVKQIEELTRDQRKSPEWREQRLKRITSSRFKTICRATERRDLKALATSMTTVSPELRAKAILHGLKYESVAIETFCEKFGAEVEPCGLFVCETHPMLAASPDGLVGEDHVVEVKCPFSAKDKKISHLTVPYLISDDNKLWLRKNHEYYFQIQGQLLCTKRKSCFFIVYTQIDMEVMLVERDDLFIQTMVDHLLKFYDEYFKQAILDSFLYHSYNLYSF